MKKFLALILALVMVMAMATTAMAVEITGGNSFTGGTDSGTVKVNVSSGTVDKVYRVEVVWSNLTFNYAFGNGATWDPVNHKYTNDAAGWEANNATITVRNHSNKAVDVEAYFDGTASAAVNQGVTATLSNNAKSTVDSADQAQYHNQTANCPEKVIGLEVTGVPTVTTGEITVGTITVTVTPTL